MIISTSYNPDQHTIDETMSLATQWDLTYIPRAHQSIARLQSLDPEQFVWIVTKQGLKGYHKTAPPMFFHPSLASIRIQRLTRGERDPLIDRCEAIVGDVILDCTAGLATDAIVLSYQVGSKGKVIALESEKKLALMISQGLASYQSILKEINQAMKRIEVFHMNHLDFLLQQADKSVDIIYFDPMFRQPIDTSSAIAAFRQFANPSALSIQAIEEAKRVARKCIVIKEQKSSLEFVRLGVHQIHQTSSHVAFGVIKL